MQVYVDDQPFEVEGAESISVGEVFEQVLRRLRAEGRIVKAFGCDGEEVPAADHQRVLGEPAADYERLDFLSCEPAELAIDALSRVQAMLMELAPTKDLAVEKLNQGQTAEAMGLLRTFFDAWRQSQEAVMQSAQLMQLDLQGVSAKGVPVAEVFERFAEQFRQLKEALEASDHVTLADIISYEADQTTQLWIDLIEAVKNAIQAR